MDTIKKTEEQRLQETHDRRVKKEQRRAIDNLLWARANAEDEMEIEDARREAIRVGADVSWIS